jgi:hypothetical protein
MNARRAKDRRRFATPHAAAQKEVVLAARINRALRLLGAQTLRATRNTRGENKMRLKARYVAAAAVVGAVASLSTVAFAGSPHFIKSAFTVTKSGTTLTVSGKEAGLGDEAQVHIVLSATAECINPGSHHPKAANKASVSAAADFPVQNGQAEVELSATATFKPDCTPPMTVVFSDITITDTTNGISVSFQAP